jgi:sporulation protein YlmC with PRC-barrel domain
MFALALFLGMAPTVAISQTQSTEPETPAVKSQDMQGTQSTEQPAATQDTQSTTETKQPANQDTTTTTQTEQPATTQDTQTTTETTPPASNDTTTVTETPTTPAPAPKAESPEAVQETETQAEVKESKPVEGQIVMQDDDSILASSMIGTSVYAPNEETIGDINDIIVNTDGTVQGVVIGVGGFLGIGEKDVAIEMKNLTLTPQADGGAPRLVLNATKEDLEAAPEFKSAADQAAESEQPAQPMTNQTTTTVPQQ